MRTERRARPENIEKKVVHGDPDVALISTAPVERQNLIVRTGMRRYTRLTDGFSKNVENHAHAVSLHFLHYNFGRPHKMLSKAAGKSTTPAVAAGIERAPGSLTQIAELLD